MALTFVDLQNKVLRWLDEGTAADADSETLDRVKEALIEADTRRAVAHRWPFLIQDPTLTFTLTPNLRTYTLDTTFRIPIYFWNRTTKSPLTQYKEEDIPTRDFTGGLIDDYLTGLTTEGGFVLRGKQIMLLWTPSGADVIEYGFYKQPVEMSADGDLPNIPAPHSRVLIYDALLELGLYNEDISASKKELWADKQEQYESALDEEFLQENADHTMPSFIEYIPED